MSRIDRFTCEEMFRRLDDFVDRELSPHEMELARQHLETCAACAAEYSFHSSMLDEVRGKLHRITIPSDLMARIAQRLGGPLRGDGAQ